MSRKIYIATFGCRTNQADSASIQEDFVAAGYEEALRPEEADVIVVNSCTVTHRSDQQVRQLTRRMLRQNAGARVLVTGCYAQRSPESLAGLQGLAGVVGNTRKGELVRIAEGVSDNPEYRRDLVGIFLDSFEKIRAIDLVPGTPIGGRTRPFVKIQDGCDARCSYCIIPSVRGPSRSVPPGQIIDQVRSLVSEGFREIVLTGIHIGTYGLYLEPRHPLDRLLEDIVRVEGLGQVRLSSIEPMELSRRVVRLAARTDRIAPHFHICLQSGSDRILKRMLRPYDAKRPRSMTAAGKV
ncbi:MAG: MiaB/RimO family radical SAM methylthiotransferase [Acidobacteriota bacterium]